ncbi:tetratricopeptide repeat domain 4 [Histomonas meleagridis]|uniref:tetratricopeptide repeat domain 4 n=1 Tax=Histomonas meleagridis TaxID=135588 RepID=UPI003559A6BA|nr:tetratricopeptide repeat domain 4 [Histomonas meleagridis]KAH0803846.1 tetratricopeptide repeat domain 4 [Histomonas meleagridis]
MKPLTPSEQRNIDATYDLVHQAAMNGVDKDEEDWRIHPMFRTDLPEDVDNDKYLSCFQTVMYENETHDSLALHFKELGNELYKSGKQNWPAASSWWTRGLQENPSDPKLKSILHSNRATVSLGLQQYQKAVLDANWAIKYDKTNKRAFLRAAHAYQGLSDWDKSLAAAKAGLEITPEEDPMHKQFEDVIKNVSEQVNSIQKRTHSYLESLNACNNYFKKRNYSVGKLPFSWMGNWDLALCFDEDKNETIWPVAVAYDEVLQIDFIEGVSESTRIIDLVSMMLPGLVKGVESPPWDSIEKRYQIDSIIVYVVTNCCNYQWGRTTKSRAQKNLEVSMECTLNDIFVQPDYVIPGYPILYIAVRNSVFADKLNICEELTPDGRKKIEQQKKVEEVTK